MAILISRSQRLTAVIGIACIFFLAEISGMHLSCPFFFFYFDLLISLGNELVLGN